MQHSSMAFIDASTFALFQWLEASAVGTAIRRSMWGFAIVEMAHLLFLAGLGGAVLVLSARVLAPARWRVSVARLARDITPLLLVCLAGLIVSGVALVSAEALRCYSSRPFWVKMALLAIAVAWQAEVHRRALRVPESAHAPIQARLAALVAVILWLSVGAAGRAIGFLV